MTQVNVRVHGVQKIFPGGVEAVAAMDLELSPGRVTALLGPTGCGKSTLLQRAYARCVTVLLSTLSHRRAGGGTGSGGPPHGWTAAAQGGEVAGAGSGSEQPSFYVPFLASGEELSLVLRRRFRRFRPPPSAAITITITLTITRHRPVAASLWNFLVCRLAAI